MYMIAMETEGRKPLFGRLTGNPFAARGSSDEPRIVLTPLGEAVQSEWMGIHGYYPQIEVMAVQMMPDHMHGILFVTAPLPLHLGQVISGFKAGCRKAWRKLREAEGRPQVEGGHRQSRCIRRRQSRCIRRRRRQSRCIRRRVLRLWRLRRRRVRGLSLLAATMT